jgi:hypothetical protein
MARVARRGEPVIVRQTLSGSDYGLIDDATLSPRPDYWTSVLWRTLVGTRVLDASSGGDSLLRVYAHCTRAGAPDQTSGSVTLVVVNIDPADGAELDLDALAGDQADVYALAASDPASTSVALNGTTLVEGSDGSLPSLAPARATRSGGELRATFPPASYGFVVLPGAAAPACP